MMSRLRDQVDDFELAASDPGFTDLPDQEVFVVNFPVFLCDVEQRAVNGKSRPRVVL